GVPPAARTPSLTRAARSRRCRLHGITSVKVETTATNGRSRSASESPVPFSIARAGARAGPFFNASLFTFENPFLLGKKKAPHPFPGAGPFVGWLRYGGPHPALISARSTSSLMLSRLEMGAPARRSNPAPSKERPIADDNFNGLTRGVKAGFSLSAHFE